jgi:hypothetical protein
MKYILCFAVSNKFLFPVKALSKVFRAKYLQYLRDIGIKGHSNGFAIENKLSRGYRPVGYLEVENAAFLNWQSKTGNGSVYTSIKDLYLFDRSLYAQTMLNAQSVKYLEEFGYDKDLYAVKWDGGALGYSATLDRYFDDELCIIVLSNNYSTASRIISDSLERIFHDK